MQKSLCACPIFNNAPDEVTVASVTYQGERVPDLDNIVISPDKGGGASTALILSIALPIAGRGFVRIRDSTRHSNLDVNKD